MNDYSCSKCKKKKKKNADQGSYEVVELTSSSSFTGSAAFTGVGFWSTDLQLHEIIAWEFIQQKYIDALPKSIIKNYIEEVVTHGGASVGGQVAVALTVRDFPGWHNKEHTLAWSRVIKGA